MGYQVIKQPDARFAVFSTFTDTIVIYDATRQEIVDWFVEITVERARRSGDHVMDAVAEGDPRRIYAQFTMTWDEALAQDREHDGEVWRQRA